MRPLPYHGHLVFSVRQADAGRMIAGDITLCVMAGYMLKPAKCDKSRIFQTNGIRGTASIVRNR
jgi:hypothetical protein